MKRSPTSAMRKRISPSVSTNPNTATMSCGFCSFAVIRICRRRSKSRLRSASSRDSPLHRSRAFFLSAMRRWNSELRARKRASQNRMYLLKRRARSSAASASPRSRRCSTWCSTKATRARASPRARSFPMKRSASRGFCCVSFPPSPRSWGLSR